MKQYETFSKGEELLAQVLEECLEEDLSFVPPEREIARKHQFSERFEESMTRFIASSSQRHKEKEIRKHFYPGYGFMAACVLLFCVCGYLFGTVVVPVLDGGKSSSAPMESAPDMAASMDEAPEEEAADMAEAAPEEPAAGQDAGVAIPEERQWCGQTVYLAEHQEVPEVLEYVTTLVNCPVLSEDDPALFLTIGNVGEEPVRYLNLYNLEVRLDDGWYVVPALSEDGGSVEELEPGMAVDVKIDLSNYQIDYGAQQYRLIVYVDDEAVSAEFAFEEVFSEKMEKLEGETSGE